MSDSVKQKSKHSQESDKNNTIVNNDNNAQVFVLPPNLLQKLGISLEGVGLSHTKPVLNNSDNKLQIDSNILITKTNDALPEVEQKKESPMSDTAELMKKSLFLSPTFIPIMNNVSEEVEITNIFNDSRNSDIKTLNLSKDYKCCLHQGKTQTMDSDTNANGININQNALETSHAESVVIHTKAINVDDKSAKSANFNIPLKVLPQSNYNIEDYEHEYKTNLNKNVLTVQDSSHIDKVNIESNSPIITNEKGLRINDDHQDEAYSSDCSNSNFEEHPSKSEQFEATYGIDKMSSGTQSNIKVNILSEEIITPNRFLQFKEIISPNQNNLIPITVNSILEKVSSPNYMNRYRSNQMNYNLNNSDVQYSPDAKIPNDAGSIEYCSDDNSIKIDISIASINCMESHKTNNGLIITESNKVSDDAMSNVIDINLCALDNNESSESSNSAKYKNFEQSHESCNNKIPKSIITDIIMHEDDTLSEKITTNQEAISISANNMITDIEPVKIDNYFNPIEEKNYKHLNISEEISLKRDNNLNNELHENVLQEIIQNKNNLINSNVQYTPGADIPNDAGSIAFLDSNYNSVKFNSSIASINCMVSHTTINGPDSNVMFSEEENVVVCTTDSLSSKSEQAIDTTDFIHSVVIEESEIGSIPNQTKNLIYGKVNHELISSQSNSINLVDIYKNTDSCILLKNPETSKHINDKYVASCTDMPDTLNINDNKDFVHSKLTEVSEIGLVTDHKSNSIYSKVNHELINSQSNSIDLLDIYKKTDSCILLKNPETSENINDTYVANRKDLPDSSNIKDHKISHSVSDCQDIQSVHLSFDENNESNLKIIPSPKVKGYNEMSKQIKSVNLIENNSHSESVNFSKLIEHENSSKNVEIKKHKLSINELGHNNPEVKNIELNKIGEIAKYLNTHYARNQTRKKRNLEKKIYNRHEISKTNSKYRFLESKMCVQGIEKPGGEQNEIDEIETNVNKLKNCKTYKKTKNIVYKHRFETQLGIFNYCNSQKALDNDINIMIMRPSNDKIEYCLCSDYGNLSYYDDDNLYQHIHFLERKYIDCNVNDIFSIYHEDNISSEEEYNNVPNLLDIEDENIGVSYSICWNTIKYDQEEYHTHKQDQELDKLTCDDVNSSNQLPDESDMKSETERVPDTQNESDSLIEVITYIEVSDNVAGKSEPNQEMSSNNVDEVVKQFKPNPDNREIDKVANKSEKKGKKRKRSQQVRHSKQDIEEPSNKKQVKCGVCKLLLTEDEWENHLIEIHSYIGWKDGETFDFYSDELKEKLKLVLNNRNKLICSNCGTQKKIVKNFLRHIRKCLPNRRASTSTQKESTNNRRETDESVTATELREAIKSDVQVAHSDKSTIENESLFNTLVHEVVRKRKKNKKPYVTTEGITEDNDKGQITCGVCHKDIEGDKWIEHIQKEHNYLAWKIGEPVLSLDNEYGLFEHFNDISKKYGELICSKCGLKRKYPNPFLRHLKSCKETEASTSTPQKESAIETREINESVIASELGATKQAIQVANTDISTIEDESLLNTSEQEVVRKRKKNTKSNVSPNGVTEDDGKGQVTCGVCRTEIEGYKWIEHIQKEHNYLAWKIGERELNFDDEVDLLEHLNVISKHYGKLVCSKCGLKRKYANPFLRHLKFCNETEMEIELSVRDRDSAARVVCGVCKEQIMEMEWIEHIKISHNYLAWRDGNIPLNLENKDDVFQHLLVLIGTLGALVCAICSSKHESVKSYLKHVENCTKDETQTSNVRPAETEKSIVNNEMLSIKKELQNKEEFVICAVCSESLQVELWHKHLQNAHNYLAWMVGEQEVDFSVRQDLEVHLQTLSKRFNGLECNKCGLVRKYVKKYLQHIETCNWKGGTDVNKSFKLSSAEDTFEKSSDDALSIKSEVVECAVCCDKVKKKNWKSHAMEKHYNLAYAIGDSPIDFRNANEVEKYIKAYLTYKKSLVCKNCKTSRASCMGFYAHLLTCEKSEEEIARYQDYCNICNSKYLCIYKNQHMKAHRDQELAKERKQLALENREKLKEEALNTSGRRQAAVKAQNVIENYSSGHKYNYNCSCGFGTDNRTMLSVHNCQEEERASDSDVSVKMEVVSDEESAESNVDSDASLEQEQESGRRKKKYFPQEKFFRIKYSVKSPKSYIMRSAEEFKELYLTREMLYPDWHSCDYKPVLEDEIHLYSPPLEQSCNIKLAKDKWMTIDRFQAHDFKEFTAMFVGSCIRCVSWLPLPAVESKECAAYLAVAGYSSADTPRIAAELTVQHPGLLQIWDYGDFTRLPKFVLGIAHNFGTVWGMDWCPSGARDDLPEQKAVSALRLGLLAVACSNGSAYIFSVPYPHTVTEENKLFFKLKPVADLRISMSDDRRKYQATSVRWSPQKNHNLMCVGYSDGSVAYYDLETDSPLLKTSENDITIFYPYNDDRSLNNSVLDVAMYAGEGDAFMVSSVGPTGGLTRLVGSARDADAYSLVPSCGVAFQPHWPASVIATEPSTLSRNVTEMDWFGGRRLGAVRAFAGCVRCARVVVYAPPALRCVQMHPAYREVKRQVISRLDIVPLDKNRKQHNDELSMKLEPTSYEQVVKKYGIVYKSVKDAPKPGVSCPERFPLADVPSMAFCPSASHHNKLALATHAGLILIIDVH